MLVQFLGDIFSVDSSRPSLVKPNAVRFKLREEIDKVFLHTKNDYFKNGFNIMKYKP